MKQLELNPRRKGKLRGAAGSELCDCHGLARAAFGRRAGGRNSGVIAFAYLWRRFGPPWWGSDEYKRIAQYVLTTADPEVFLTVSPSASSIDLCVGYVVTERVDRAWRKAVTDPWRRWEKLFERWFWRQNPKLSRANPPAKATVELYYEWRHDQVKLAAAEKEIGAWPNPHRESRWRSGPPLMRRVNQALFDAMQELLRPVGVRDANINVFGLTDDDGGPVDPSEFAGFPIPIQALRAMQRKRKRRAAARS